MRQLGSGQSVVFCIPEEISNKILVRTSKSRAASIEVMDVLRWAVAETSADIRRSMPLWAVQGQRFDRQSRLSAEAQKKGSLNISKDQAKKFLEKECQSLEVRYRPHSGTDVTSVIFPGQSQNNDLIIERCRQFSNLEFSAATLQEEQERELSPEIEAERQVQKPPSAEPDIPSIHNDLRKFISEGTLVIGSGAYEPAFGSLCNTSPAKENFDVSQFPKDLLVSKDFSRTIKESGQPYFSDSFKRPVQWILTSTLGEASNVIKNMMIVSPYEAQVLLPKIKESKFVALHLYAPRPNLSFCALDGLDLYTVPALAESRIVPRHFAVQLNLFSGQLYLNSYEEYVEMCKFLGLAWQKTEDGCVVAADGFIMRRDGVSGMATSTFTKSPVTFLRIFFTKIRRNCESIDKTHMGNILDGRLLLPSDFEEAEVDKC
jgi:hypothetical protein